MADPEPHVELKINEPLDAATVLALYKNAGLNRPDDVPRIAKMYQNSNLVISAWLNGELVGVARSLTDFSFCCYLSDLAVKKEVQKLGIGRQLIQKTQEVITDQCTLLLIAAPTAVNYYPKVGFAPLENGFQIKRKS